MRRREFISLLGGAAACPWAAHAQEPTSTIPRIGFLANIRSPATEAFERGLRELGYVEGKNIVIEWRLAQGKFETLPELAADLVRLNVRVIVAPAQSYVRAASQASSSTPIVFALVGDPVGVGFVTSLAHPGGMITGVSSIAIDLSAKRLEILKETLPGLTRVAVLTDWIIGETEWRKQLESAARSLNVQLLWLEFRTPSDLEPAFSRMAAERTQAIMVLGAESFYPHRKRFAELAMTHRLPSMVNLRSTLKLAVSWYMRPAHMI